MDDSQSRAKAIDTAVRAARGGLRRVAGARWRVGIRELGPGVLDGPEQIRRAVERLQDDARHEVFCIDRPPYAGTPASPVERRRLADGVSYRVVYDRSALSVPGYLELVSELVELGERARVGSTVPMKLMIVDRAVAVTPLRIQGDVLLQALLIQDPALVAGLVRVFTDAWRAAVPLGPEGMPLADTPERPSSEERQVLALLAAGATDEMIGRLLNVSPRTAHRRVRDLAAKLGAETRFQAGVQAVRLGWL